jgi:hypothetical protein
VLFEGCCQGYSPYETQVDGLPIWGMSAQPRLTTPRHDSSCRDRESRRMKDRNCTGQHEQYGSEGDKCRANRMPTFSPYLPLDEAGERVCDRVNGHNSDWQVQAQSDLKLARRRIRTKQVRAALCAWSNSQKSNALLQRLEVVTQSLRCYSQEHALNRPI